MIQDGQLLNYKGHAARRVLRIGQGSVPFAAVAEWLRTHGYRQWIVVEQDVLPGMGAPKTSAQRNRSI